jgi:hypothetical protein
MRHTYRVERRCPPLSEEHLDVYTLKAYIVGVEFIETATFTRWVTVNLSDAEYRERQRTLTEHPNAGDLIPGGGGLRKVRWSTRGRGTRGGARVIYYWAVSRHTILLLYGYRKNEHGDLNPDQLRVLKMLARKEFP